jgi:hypothetical protein
MRESMSWRWCFGEAKVCRIFDTGFRILAGTVHHYRNLFLEKPSMSIFYWIVKVLTSETVGLLSPSQAFILK